MSPEKYILCLKYFFQFVTNESYKYNTKYFPQWYKRALNVFNLSSKLVVLIIQARLELLLFNVNKDYLY